MAVPITDRTGKTVAALSISVRANRLRFSDFRAQLLPHLLSASESLSSRIVLD
jgi:DNA-binding IclR family transcriptional regulator